MKLEADGVGSDEARALVAYALDGARGRNFINRKIIASPAAPLPIQ